MCGLLPGQGMVQAIWNGAILADSDATVVVEGNHYFPPDSVQWDRLQPSSTHTTCPWKGLASYYTLLVGDRQNEDAAWTYPEPSPEAQQIKGHVAFWHGVEVR